MVKMSLILGSGLVALLTSPGVLADTLGPEQINWFNLGMALSGGLALFLFGLDQVSRGLKGAAGDSLKSLLAKLTKNRVMGAITGAIVTAMLNSSSVTTVLVVGFITAGIMSLTQSIGVIMGANIGSTFTAQIIAFNITQYALLMVALGFLMLFLGQQEKTRYYGELIMGLGLVFFGMGVMSDAMTPLRSFTPFIELMAKLESPLLGILVGAVFTGLVQSSAATTGIAIVMASEGLMSLPAGIALALGSNIGTCLTAMLASIGKPTEAKRAAVAHILFNILGVLVWLPFIQHLAEFVIYLSPSYPDLGGTARMAAEAPRQIANAHTVFNVANTLLFLGFTGYFAKIVVKLTPERPSKENLIIQPKYLDKAVLPTPSLAMERVRLELGRLGDIVQAMFTSLPDAFLSRKREALKAIAKMDDEVDVLQANILEYLAEIRRQELTDEQSHVFLTLMTAADNLESIGDVIETEFVALGMKTLDQNIQASATIREILTGLHGTVLQALQAAVRAVRDDDQKAAQEVMALKDEVHRRIDESLIYQASTIGAEKTQQLARLRVEMEALDKLKRTYALTKRIAKTVLPKELTEVR